MPLDYFEEGLEGDPSLLIHSDEQAAWAELHASVRKLLSRPSDVLEVHGVNGFKGITGCQLFCRIGTSDIGVQRLGSGLVFEYVLTRTWWDNNEGLIEPFSWSPNRRPSGDQERFQFLDVGQGEISVIISTFRG